MIVFYYWCADLLYFVSLLSLTFAKRYIFSLSLLLHLFAFLTYKHMHIANAARWNLFASMLASLLLLGKEQMRFRMILFDRRSRVERVPTYDALGFGELLIGSRQSYSIFHAHRHWRKWKSGYSCQGINFYCTKWI